jgi:microcin C transport system substrate-binding protein
MRRVGRAVVAMTVVLGGLCSVSASAGGKSHGQALRAQLKYPATFKAFDFANPAAPKGGILTLALFGSFDTLNPYSDKGMSPGLIALADVFETLMAKSYDEPFAQYGLLAQQVEVAADEMSTTFHLNPAAQFSDGKPVTGDDVVFSFKTLTSEKSRPFFKMYYADVKDVVAVNKTTVKFLFARKNAELPLILGELPILPKHVYGEKGKNFSTDFVGVAVGSGPYVIKEFEYSKFIKAERNPSYWGAGLPVNAGRYNFNTLVMKYFKDPNVLVEGYKAGEFDFMTVNSSKAWAKDFEGEKFTKNWVLKKFWPHSQTQGMQGFLMNTRRPVFQDRYVRKALALALDFDWMNKSLFFGQYTAQASYFDNSELAAKGLPSPEELKLLEPLRSKLPEELFTEPMGKPLGSGLDARGRLEAARKLLEKAGYKIQGNTLVGKDGKPFEFTLLLGDSMWQRIAEPYTKALSRLGIKATVKLEDDAIYQRRIESFDFDMIVDDFGQSESPGNEQRDMWSSTAADTKASRNTAGIKDSAIDALIDKVIRAGSRADLVTAVRALDRALWFGSYMVPHWYVAGYRVTYANKFSLPEKMPLYFGAQNYFTSFGWLDAAKEDALKTAVKSGKALAK